jgi:hypothetical protein
MNRPYAAAVTQAMSEEEKNNSRNAKAAPTAARENAGEAKEALKTAKPTPGKPAAPQAKTRNKKPPRYNKLAEVPADVLRHIDELLVDGATFEDVVENLEGEELGRIPLHIVSAYFRGNVDLQKRRVLRQVAKAKELKKSLGKPESAEAKLADAIFITGYMGVTRKGAEIKLKDVESIRLSKENLRLRNRVLRQKDKQDRQQKRYRQLRNEMMQKKVELYKLKIAALKKAMAAESGQNKLGPETMQAIEEIYGVATIPSLPAEIR